MKHRKLFPGLTNQTDCSSDSCYCPYGCYPYADSYLMPPPSPPPPPLPTHQRQQLSSPAIITYSLIGSFSLLPVVYISYLIIARYCCCRNGFGPPETQSEDQDEDFLDGNQGPAIDHPIWFINSIGLQPSVINSITVFKYKKGDLLIEGSECSVCLSEFQEDETLRLLPKCNHAFHIPCIDTWLRSHTNCPLCRAGILSNTWSASNPSASDGQNSVNLRPEEDTQMENSEGNRELGENRTETEAEVELPTAHDERKELGNSNGCSVFSVSVEISAAATISSDVAESEANSANRREDLQQSNLGIVQAQDVEIPRMNGMMGSDSITQSVHKSPVSLKRSFSYGGRLFLPKHSRNLSSILPL